MTQGTPTLYTLAPSHFCERARWGLDRLGIAYVEHRLALGPHAVFLKSKGLPATTLPVLVDGASLIQGSGAILDHIGLDAADAAFEARFERDIGPLVRRFVYAAAFQSEDPGIRDVLLEGVSQPERALGIAAWPALVIMMRSTATAPGAYSALCDSITKHLDWFDKIVGGVEAPLNQQFGRADITAASLLYPLAAVPHAPTTLRPRYAETIRALLAQWQGRPSLQWVRATYETYRRLACV